ncbi:MAG: hypothetical protein ACI9MC_002313 [Kiritimatiellia bacterium]|jgi:hypothetical protein
MRSARPTVQSAQVGYQRDRLAVRSLSSSWYVVVDGYGRVLSAQQFARALGDVRTYNLSGRVGRKQTAVGSTATSVGPVAMLVGAAVASNGGWRESDHMEIAGYGTVIAGLLGTAGGIALLADQRPRRPPTFYDEAQARRLVSTFNARLLEAYGLSPDQAAILPSVPRKQVYARVVASPLSVGVQGAF